MTLYFFYENLLFVTLATSFFGLVGWMWRNTKPYNLPSPLPDWFKVWFLTIQIGGGAVPLGVLIWSIWQGRFNVVTVLVSYFAVLVLQILSESVSLRRFHSTVFVMVPYLYLPYRIWQLYQGMELFQAANEPVWLQNLLLAEIVLWTLNYGLDLAQLPRLFHWNTKQ